MEELKEKYRVSENNLKIAKSLLRKTSDLNLEKDLKIIQMTSKSEKNNSSDVLYEQYSNHFDSHDMLKIRSIKPGIQQDSAFILTIMKSLYKNDVEKLKDRSATGRKFKGIKKHEITLEKKEILENMLIQRVKSELHDKLGTTKNFLKRIGRFNTLLRYAIGNLVSKIKKNQSQKSSDSPLVLESDQGIASFTPILQTSMTGSNEVNDQAALANFLQRYSFYCIFF